MREFSCKLVTFEMAEGGHVSQAQLKRELDQLSKELFGIDIKIQSFRAQGNNTHIPALEAVRAEITKVQAKQVELELRKCQSWKARRH